MDDVKGKHSISLRRDFTAQRIACILYLCALVLYVLWFSLSATYIGDAFFLQQAAKFYRAAIRSFFVFFLFCIFLLDAFLNRISARKMVFGVVAIIMLQILITNATLSEMQKYGLQFFVWLLLAYPKRLELRYAFYSVLIAGAIVSVASIALSVAGFIPNTITDGPFGLMKSTFGFKSMSVENLYLCSLIMGWTYCASCSWSWRKAIIAFVLIAAAFFVTSSRAGALLVFAQIIITCLMNQKGKWAWVEKVLMPIVYKSAIVIVPVFSILCLAMAQEISIGDLVFVQGLDSLMGGSLTVGDEFYKAGGFHLIGQGYKQYASVSNSYLYIAMVYGFICLAWLMILYYRVGSYLGKKGDANTSLYIVLLAILMLFDSIMFVLVYNMAALAIGEYLATGSNALVEEREP